MGASVLRRNRVVGVAGSATLLAGLMLAGQPAQAAPAANATQAAHQDAESVAAKKRPNFRMPFACGQKWRGRTYHGHIPAHSIDWNHYRGGPGGTPDDRKRRVFASAKGTVVESYKSSGGYGNTIVISHKRGWKTRYAHLWNRKIKKEGTKVKRGQMIGRVGETGDGIDDPHLHYEQIKGDKVRRAVVQGKRYPTPITRWPKSKNRCNR